MLRAFFDAAGTHGGEPVIILAGVVAYADRWEQFETKWRALCAINGVEYIHGVELFQRRGQFKGWSEPDCAALAQKAAHLVVGHARYCMGLVLSESDFQAHYRSPDKTFRSGPDSRFGVCIRALYPILAQIIQKYESPENREVHVVFERGDKNQGAAQTIAAEFAQYAPDLAKVIRGPTYEDKFRCPGVQAADIGAYPALRLERQNADSWETIDLDAEADLPDAAAPHNFRIPVTATILSDFRQGQYLFSLERKRAKQAAKPASASASGQPA